MTNKADPVKPLILAFFASRAALLRIQPLNLPACLPCLILCLHPFQLPSFLLTGSLLSSLPLTLKVLVLTTGKGGILNVGVPILSNSDVEKKNSVCVRP